MAERLTGYDQPISRQLFHATKAASVESIVNEGVDTRYRGPNGANFGFGGYFATDASTAHPFTSTVANEDKTMFLCRVLTGKFCLGGNGLEVPPLLDRAIPEGMKYDSVVDSEEHPTEWVVFQSGQSYPLYLITISCDQG